MKALSKPLLIFFFVLANYTIAFSQPTVTSLNFYALNQETTSDVVKGHDFGGNGATEVPLNYFIIEVIFDRL